MAFAFGLLLGDHGLSQCTHLLEPENELRAQRLAELLGVGKDWRL
jgi:ArsR family metal-binding transcriptional regulator